MGFRDLSNGGRYVYAQGGQGGIWGCLKIMGVPLTISWFVIISFDTGGEYPICSDETIC